jgi:Ku protein
MGLVNIPMQVVKATGEAKDVAFKMADPRNGSSLAQKYVAADGTLYDKGQVAKAIDGKIVAADALSNIEAQTKIKDFEVEEIVSMDEIRARMNRVDGMYYLQPNPKMGSTNAFRLFTDALAATGQAIVTKWTPRSRQQQVAIYAQDGILMAVSLVFAGDVREPDAAVRAEGTYTEQEMEMAKQLLGVLATPTPNVLDTAQDDAIPMRQQLVDKILKGEKLPVQETVEQPEANADLAAALSASIAAMKVPA